MTDHLTELGARHLAVSIKDYWKRRGHQVRVWIEEVEGARQMARGSDVRGAVFAVRSNLENGLPRGMAGWSPGCLKEAA